MSPETAEYLEYIKLRAEQAEQYYNSSRMMGIMNEVQREVNRAASRDAENTVNDHFVQVMAYPDGTNVPIEDDGTIRKFQSGATRDTAENKLDYEGFDAAIVKKRYAEYMHGHRKQSDGSLRSADNWQKGIPQEAYAGSLIRHVEDFHLVWDGFPEEVTGGTEDIEEILCAIIFNAKGLLFEKMMERKGRRKAG